MTEEELANFTAMMADRNYQTFLRFGEMIQKSLVPVLEIYKKIIVESIPVIMQRIIDKHKEIMRMWSDYLEEYLSRSFEIIPIQHFDLLFCDSPSIQETHIACNHSNAPPKKSIDIESQYNNCTINNYYTDQSKYSFDWKYWLQIAIGILSIVIPLLGVL